MVGKTPKIISKFPKDIQQKYRKIKLQIDKLQEQRKSYISKSKELDKLIQIKRLDLTNLQLNNNIIISQYKVEKLENEKN